MVDNRAIWIHGIFILLAFGISFWIIFRAKGTRQHRIFGWIFTVCMAVSLMSTFWIQTTTGGFSFIHILSVATLYWLIRALIAIRFQHNRYIHAKNMLSAYLGIFIAGIGVIVRHFIAPGDVLLGGITSGLLACIVIPITSSMLKRYKLS